MCVGLPALFTWPRVISHDYRPCTLTSLPVKCEQWSLAHRRAVWVKEMMHVACLVQRLADSVARNTATIVTTARIWDRFTSGETLPFMWSEQWPSWGQLRTHPSSLRTLTSFWVTAPVVSESFPSAAELNPCLLSRLWVSFPVWTAVLSQTALLPGLLRTNRIWNYEVKISIIINVQVLVIADLLLCPIYRLNLPWVCMQEKVTYPEWSALYPSVPALGVLNRSPVGQVALLFSPGMKDTR